MLSKPLLNMRAASHKYASSSGREVWPCRCRSRGMQVQAALFEPPPFQPKKLSIQYLAGARPPNSLSAPVSRRYTLTHNDITGALNLSIGSDYNQQQIQGFYTRILRDEITAEWYFTAGAAAPAELHIYCHVSGEERWLAPPQLRNFIFRREMTLVLDTFYYADREFLLAFPDLLSAKVYVHFQSDVQDLDLREYWGTLGDRRSWRRMPRGVLARLKLLLFGFPAVPHQRPRTALTWQQQQRRQQQQQEGMKLMPAIAAVAGQGNGVLPHPSQQQQTTLQQQWHLSAEAVVDKTRPVALSLQEQRKLHPQEPAASQQQQQVELDGLVPPSSSVSSDSSSCSRCPRESVTLQQQSAEQLLPRDLEAGECESRLASVAVVSVTQVEQPALTNGQGESDSSRREGHATVAGSENVTLTSSATVSDSRNLNSDATDHECPGPAECQQQQQQQQDVQQSGLVTSGLAAGQPLHQQPQQPKKVVQQREQVLAFSDPSEVFQEYGYWLRPGGKQRSRHNSTGALLPVVALDGSATSFQTVLQQKAGGSMRSAVVAAAAVHGSSSYSSNQVL